MKLSPEAIREYKEVHFQEFGVLLNDEEAEVMARKWLSFFKCFLTSNAYGNEESKP